MDARDPDRVLHLALDTQDTVVRQTMERMVASLKDLGVSVSTGRVVDFRARHFLRQHPEGGTVPLIYPTHFNGAGVHWPRKDSRKANALVSGHETADLLVPNGNYVLVKRFTAKEEKRRVVATVFSPKGALKKFEAIGFENHLNYFHSGGRPLDEEVATGLFVYLNSTLVDAYFRQFSGHTQVNATDLRNLRYPTRNGLRALANTVKGGEPAQPIIDQAVASLT
jgi:adenine-specific DNA-methyltransferase